MCCHLCKLSKNARLTLIAALTQFSSHVNSHSVHRFLATHTLATASPLANYTHCSLQLQLIWNSWRSGNPFDSRLDCSPRCFYMHFDCCSFAARSFLFFFLPAFSWLCCGCRCCCCCCPAGSYFTWLTFYATPDWQAKAKQISWQSQHAPARAQIKRPARPTACGLRRLQFQLGYSRQKKYTHSIFICMCATLTHM